jgi:DNA-binding FrmR family transcriptional regulator
MTREDFVTRWRTRQSEWARIGALVDGARLCEDVLQDFEAVTRAEDDAELSLSEAAAESGYSSDHLRRLHRLGKVPAYRKGRNLFFRSGDLPRKPTARTFSPYDPVADARRVLNERQEPRPRDS